MVRGNFLNPAEKVSPNVPAILPPLPEGKPVNRLALARWLVSPANPLTARVTMNRFWEQIFGRGLVETVEDFGTQGERPTHPELLDWLATEFVRQNWDIKEMLRHDGKFRHLSPILPFHTGNAGTATRITGFMRARPPGSSFPAEAIRDIATYRSQRIIVAQDRRPSAYSRINRKAFGRNFTPPTNGSLRAKEKINIVAGFIPSGRRTSTYPAFMSFDAPSRELICLRAVNVPIRPCKP